MIGFHQPDDAPGEMVLNAASVLACLRSLVCQPTGGDYLQLEGNAHHGLYLILEGIGNTLEAAGERL